MSNNKDSAELIKNEITIEKYLSEKKDEIFEFINHHNRLLISANPASGKTTLFADLCVSHIKNKRSGRIIFCCPFLIIQKQFKKRIETKGSKIDFELNGKSKRKKLIDSDKIITSTYHSLKLISNELKEEDLIIIDEAHSILFTYINNKNIKTFFADFVKCVYKTSAKLVLMTGTPQSGVVELLSLTELKIKLNDVCSKINIQYSNEKDTNLVLAFAENCLNKFDNDYLNVIYVKNKNKCHVFKALIDSHFNCNSVVLTSDEKDSNTYIKLAEESLIPNKYQFLITTNVISTGTNILNDKIGKALMLNEFDPTEIKQFSKRFRKKLNIEIDVINPKHKEPHYNPVEQRDSCIAEREGFRLIYKKLLQDFEQINSEKVDYVEFDNRYFDKYLGSPNQLIDICLERFLIQETYYKKQIIETYNSPTQLKEALNEFNDIISVEINDYSDTYTDTDLGEKQIKDKQVDDVNVFFDKFILKPDLYLKCFHEYLTKSHNIFWLNKLENTLGLSFLSEETNKKVYATINNINLNNTLVPLIENYSFFYDVFKDVPKTLYFIKKNTINKRSPLKIAIYFNTKFHEFFNIVSDDSKGFVSLKLQPKKNIENPIDILTSKFIKHTFKYLINHDYINYDDFKTHLISNKIKLSKSLTKELSFPFSFIGFDMEQRVLSSIQKAFVIGLSRSIFKLKTEQQHLKSNGIRKSTYRFEEDLKSVGSSINIFQAHDIVVENDASVIFKLNSITSKHKAINLNTSTRILIDKNALINTILDETYYINIHQN